MRRRGCSRGHGAVRLGTRRHDAHRLVSPDLVEPSTRGAPGAGRADASGDRGPSRSRASCCGTGRGGPGCRSSSRVPAGCGGTGRSSPAPRGGLASSRQAACNSSRECGPSACASRGGRGAPANTRLGDHSIRTLLAGWLGIPGALKIDPNLEKIPWVRKAHRAKVSSLVRSRAQVAQAELCGFSSPSLASPEWMLDRHPE